MTWSSFLFNMKEHPKIFSGGIWAFHFGYDNSAYPSMERAAQLIENTGEQLRGSCINYTHL